MSAPGVQDPITRRTIERLQNEVRQLRGSLEQVIRNNQLVVKHSDLTQLDFSSSGHTGFASTAQLSAHTSDTSNPHIVTAAQVGNSTAQWNANQLQGRDVQDHAPLDTEVLTWVSANNRWEPGSGGGGGASELNDLSDVTITSAGAGDMLHHNGAGQFVNTKTFTGDYTFSSSTTDSVIGVPNGGASIKHLAAGTATPNSSYSLTTAGSLPVYLNSFLGVGTAPSSTYRVRSNLNHSSSGTKYGYLGTMALSSSTASAGGIGFALSGTYSGSGANQKVVGSQVIVQLNKASSTISSGTFKGGDFVAVVLSDNTTITSDVEFIGGDFWTKLTTAANDSTIERSLAGRFSCNLGFTNNAITDHYNAYSKTPWSSTAGGAVTNFYGFYAAPYTNAVNDPAITNGYAFYAADQTDDTSVSGNCDVFRIEAQDGANASALNGNFNWLGQGYNRGHLVIGGIHLHSDGTALRAKTSAPTSDVDGIDLMETGAMVTNYDDAGGGVSYIGDAEAGSSAASAVWRVRKMVEASGDVTITFADGDDDFDNIWANRASLSYS